MEILSYVLGGLLGLVLLIGGYLIIYLIARFKIISLIPNVVNMAETSKVNGKEKLTLAIGMLCDAVPSVVKPFLTKAMLEKLIEKAFESIDAYGKKQISKTENEPNKND